jgi:hypothetical protein
VHGVPGCAVGSARGNQRDSSVTARAIAIAWVAGKTSVTRGCPAIPDLNRKASSRKLYSECCLAVSGIPDDRTRRSEIGEAPRAMRSARWLGGLLVVAPYADITACSCRLLQCTQGRVARRSSRLSGTTRQTFDHAARLPCSRSPGNDGGDAGDGPRRVQVSPMIKVSAKAERSLWARKNLERATAIVRIAASPPRQRTRLGPAKLTNTCDLSSGQLRAAAGNAAAGGQLPCRKTRSSKPKLWVLERLALLGRASAGSAAECSPRPLQISHFVREPAVAV